MVVDIHKPMLEATKKGRKASPTFTLAPDAVRPGDEEHWIMARTVLEAWGAGRSARPDTEVLRLIREKWQVLGPAWLARVGHKRNPKPVDFADAQAKASELERRDRALAAPGQR